MSFAAEGWAWDQKCESDLCSSSAAKLVLVCLAWYANKEGEKAYPSLATICKKTDLAERTVRKALLALQQAGLIEHHFRHGDSKEHQRFSAEYRLIIRDSTPVDLPGGGGSKSTGEGEVNLLPRGGKSATGGDANLVPELYIEPRKEEGTELRSDAQSRVVPIRADIRAQLFQEGSVILRETVGMLRSPAGGQISKFLKIANGDCGVVLDAMRAAKREGVPADGVIGFIVQGIRIRTPERSLSSYEQIMRDGQFESFLFSNRQDDASMEAVQ